MTEEERENYEDLMALRKAKEESKGEAPIPLEEAARILGINGYV